MLGTTVLEDLEVEAVKEALQFKTAYGSSTFLKEIQNVSSDPNVLRKRQLPLLALRASPDVTTKLQEHLASLDVSCLDNFTVPKDELQSTALNQVFMDSDGKFSWWNTSGWTLNLWLTWKTILLPFFALILPTLVLFAPFILVDGITSSAAYLESLRAIILRQITIPPFLKSRGADDRIGFIMESGFILITMTTFLCGMLNQLYAALTTRGFWFDLESHANRIHDVQHTISACLTELESLGKRKQRALRDFMAEGRGCVDALQTYARGVPLYGAFYNTPELATRISSWIGKLDMYLTLVGSRTLCFPSYSLSDGKGKITGVIHPVVESCISNNFELRSTILTGPNRGGKSTYTKAIGLAILCAQSLGVAFASSMTVRPYTALLTHLQGRAVLGTRSTFESDIEFSKTVLGLAAMSRPCVLMDEIFHATNAHDGLLSSEIVYGSMLERFPEGLLFLSTHYRDLVTTTGSRAASLCVGSDIRSDGSLAYTYRVCPGVNRHSSVRELLVEHGLCSLAGAAFVAEKELERHKQNES
jgi:hypothetical protein